MYPGGQEGWWHPGLPQKQSGQQDQGTCHGPALSLVRLHLESSAQFWVPQNPLKNYQSSLDRMLHTDLALRLHILRLVPSIGSILVPK